MKSIKYNYKLDIKGLLSIDDGKIIISIEDGGDYDLSVLCNDFDGKVVKISMAYDEEYDINVDPETGEVV